MIWHSKHVPITFKFGSEVGFEKYSKFYWKHFLIWVPVSELGELFKIAKFKNPIFRKIKNQKPYNFFVFWATTTIHTFLKSSDKTAIIRQGQKSDIATGKGSGAKFSLYRRTHCSASEERKNKFWRPFFRLLWWKNRRAFRWRPWLLCLSPVSKTVNSRKFKTFLEVERGGGQVCECLKPSAAFYTCFYIHQKW